MAVEQIIKCDGPTCGRVIDGNYVELFYNTKAVDPEANDHAFEAGMLQLHFECFDLLREPLGIGNPQEVFKEELAAGNMDQQEVERQAAETLEQQRAEISKQ